MNPIELRKIKNALKLLQESGEVTSKTRMEASRLMEAIAKERASARAEAASSAFNIQQPWFPEGRVVDIETSSKGGTIRKRTGYYELISKGSENVVDYSSGEFFRNPNRAYDLNINKGGHQTKEQVYGLLSRRENVARTYRAMQQSGNRGGAKFYRQQLTNIDTWLYDMGSPLWDENIAELGKNSRSMIYSQLSRRKNLEKAYDRALAKGDMQGAERLKRGIESVDDNIYKMGANLWDDQRGILESQRNTQKVYFEKERVEKLSSTPFFTGLPWQKGELGSDLLSGKRFQMKQPLGTPEAQMWEPKGYTGEMAYRRPYELLNKKGTLPESWFQQRNELSQELTFVNNFLIDPQRAQEYARTSATPGFFKYWNERGGISGLEEYTSDLKARALMEELDIAELGKVKYGKLTTIAEAMNEPFSYGTIRGRVTDVWAPRGKQSQAGLITDISGESMKYTFWKNVQGVPTVEVGKKYLFGNVPISEFRGQWGLSATPLSSIKEIKPFPFENIQPRPPVGAATEIRDYSKPYSIDPNKGTITFTTKGGKYVTMPIQQAKAADIATGGTAKRAMKSPYDTWAAGEERSMFNPYAAFIPMAGAPFLMNNATEGGGGGYDQHNAGAEVYNALLGAAGVTTELGGKWLQKGQEAYASLEARQAEYAADPSKQRKFRPLAFFEDIPYLGMGALDVLGGALYPLAYPAQAFWGSQKGIGAMEGIRQETFASDVLNIENPWQALGADVLLDPLNLIGIGILTKSKRVGQAAEMLGLSKKGMKALWADERAITGVSKAEKGPISVDDYMREYDTRQSGVLWPKELRNVKEQAVKGDYNLGGAAILAGAGAATAGFFLGGNITVGGRGGSGGRYGGVSKSEAERFRQATATRSSFQERYAIYKRDQGRSVMSGETTSLQTHELMGVYEGGALAAYNQVTLTAEENLEQARAQMYRKGLPERQYMQNRRLEELNTSFERDIARIQGTKVDSKGRPFNVAQREEAIYNRKKALNVRLLNIQLTKLQDRIRVLEKFMRNELAKGKPEDLKNAENTRKILDVYYAQYAALSTKRNTEQGKGFVLPEQAAAGEGQIGGIPYEMLVRGGRGQELETTTNILGSVNDKEFLLEYSIAVDEIAVLGLPDSAPENTKAQVVLPDIEIYRELRAIAAKKYPGSLRLNNSRQSMNSTPIIYDADGIPETQPPKEATVQAQQEPDEEGYNLMREIIRDELDNYILEQQGGVE